MAGQPRDGAAALRAVKIAVAVMGVVIVAGVAVVVGVIITRIYAKPAAPSMSAPVLPAAGGLRAGEHIAGIAAAGGEFGVWVSGPAGDRLLLVDPETGAVTVALVAGK